MRISDWSSDVCSSDLIVGVKAGPRDRGSQIVTENPGKQGRPDNVIGRTVDDHVLIACGGVRLLRRNEGRSRSEEHTSELQSLMRISYAVFCLKKQPHN